MATIVQKFGGTSVGTIERIKKVAERAVRTHRAGNRVVVVVSAMAGETNRLLGLAGEITRAPHHREIDVLISSGEQVSIGLVALAICELGEQGHSFLGHQVRIQTDDAHGMARIRSIEAGPVHDALTRGEIVVVAGFQGTNEAGKITTLGRGGSDLSAVAMAAAIGADSCEIYTDVDGVYTADPRIVAEARRLDRISFEEMLELASVGAKVLQIRSVKFAMRYGVPIHVRSSFTPDEGTWVVPEEDVMERLVVSGVTCNTNEAKIRVPSVPDQPGIAAKLFTPLADAGIVVDMIIQNLSREGTTDLTCTVPRGDYTQALDLAKQAGAAMGCDRVEGDDDIAKLSIVGLGMKDHAGVATKMFKVLAEEGINIQMISTSEIKVSVVIEEKYAELAVRALHAAFIE